MTALMRQIAVGAAAILVLAASLLLLSDARWVYGVAQGNRALAGGNVSAARQAYTIAEKRIGATLLPFVLVRSHYRQLVFNQARLLNADRKYDDLSRLLDAGLARAPELANDPEYHFWTGIAEYRKAIAQTDKQVLRAGLQQAADSFRLALTFAPEGADWDAKYNYELISRLLADMRDKDDDTQQKLKRGGMKFLREDPAHPKEQQQTLAPDKKS